MNLILDSIIIFTNDLAKLKSFYTEVFELIIEEEIDEEWILLNAGNAKIGLHKIGEKYQHTTESNSNTNTKLVFEIEGDIQKLRAKLLNMNVFVEEIKTFEDYAFWLCDGKDPDGNVFQLKQKK